MKGISPLKWLGYLPMAWMCLSPITAFSGQATPSTPAALNGAMHNALAPAGPQAAHFAELWHFTVIICCIVFSLILFAFIYAIWRSPRSEATTEVDLTSLTNAEPMARKSVIWSVVVSIALLFVLITASAYYDLAISRLDLKNALHIEVTAHQWWWEVRYNDTQPSNIFVTANEIHVPVEKPVVITLKADDVIHSFWVPSLGGKKDLIPGQVTTLNIRADKPGEYRGQCAEFCGFQHTYMAFLVTADTPEQYAHWLDNQRQSALEPSGEPAAHGKEIFLSSTCAMCHTIQGTTANAIRGPDLTHLASRKSIAAGTLANTPQNLAKWITDPHASKPGTNMPPTQLAPQDLQALVSYLTGLK